MDVEKHCPGCIADIGNMYLAPCEHPDKPCVDCAETEPAFFGFLSCSRYVFKDPTDLGCAEVGVNDKACLASYRVSMTFLLERVAVFRCASVLPYDGIIDRFSGLGVPYDGCLSLVRDADCSDVESVDVD